MTLPVPNDPQAWLRTALDQNWSIRAASAGVAVADLMTGMYSTGGILAALLERANSGLGQHIDMALLDCQVSMLANQNLNFMTSGVAPKRAGNAHQNLVPYQPVPQLLRRDRPA
ncbi:hypothetical protein G6F59_016313 [Rhizopus arrhizus]|nr:hypothetical protein G6F59_016313 [Rhizopus arrhizus]